MSDLQAFELRPEYSLEDLNGATVSHGSQGEMFDIKAALDAGKGVVVTDNSLLAGALKGHHILVPCDVPDGAEAVSLDAPVPAENKPKATEKVADAGVAAEHQDDGATPDDVLKQGEVAGGVSDKARF